MRTSGLAMTLGTILALAAGVLLGPSPATAGGTATGGWTPPTRLSQRLDSHRWAPTLASDHVSTVMLPNGGALVAWADGHGRILTALKPVGQRWSTRVVHRASSHIAFAPQLGVDAGGAVTLAWAQPRAVLAMRRPLGGGWRKPRTIVSWPRNLQPVSYLHLAVGIDATVLVTFWRGLVGRCPGIGEDCALRHVAGVAVVRPARSRWSPPFRFAGPIRTTNGYLNPALLPDHYQLTPPQGAVDGRGVVTLAWAQPKYMTTGPVFARRKVPGEPWNHRAQLTPDRADVSDPVMTAGQQGEVTVAWSRWVTGSPWQGVSLIESRTRSASGSWGARTTVGRGLWPQSLIADADGTATIMAMGVVRQQTPTRTVTWTRPAGGTWGSRVILGGRGLGELQTGQRGSSTLATWCHDGRLQTRYRTADMAWTPAVRLDRAPTCAFATAVNSTGAATAAWFHRVADGDDWAVLRAATRS